MWRIVALAFVSVSGAGALAAADLEIDVSVTRQAVADIQKEFCGRYEACTHFVAPELVAGCHQSERDWQITASARLTALVYLEDLALLGHEHEHISDMRKGISSILARLESRRFSTAGECHAAVGAATSEFRKELRSIAAQSMARRH